MSHIRTVNTEDIMTVFTYWKTIMEHPHAKLDSKRRRCIEWALSLYDVNTIKQAIDGCHRSSFHRGENPAKRVYDDLTLILRDASKLEGFVAMPDNSEQARIQQQVNKNFARVT